jgi:membrane protein implicated in regulation of membrane protease activity
MQSEISRKKGISQSASQPQNSNAAYITANVLSAWSMHLNSLLLVALLLVASGLFWWWTVGGGLFALISVAVLGLGAVLFLALRGDRGLKDELDAQVPKKDAGKKES